SSRRRHTRFSRDWSSDVCSSDLSISAFRYQPASMRLPIGHELYGLLRMLGRFAIARQAGKGLHSDQIQGMEPMLTDALVQQMLRSEERRVGKEGGGRWARDRAGR